MAWYVLQTAMGCVGALGFSILFNIRGRKLIWSMLGGGLGWVVYLAGVCHGLDVFPALLCATLAAALLSEVLARVLKAPVLMLLVPMLVPLIPGGDLYYMMSFFVRGDYESFGQRARLLLSEAGAIALGILCAASLASLAVSLHERRGAGR